MTRRHTKRWVGRLGNMLPAVLALVVGAQAAPPSAFPGAEGFGATAKGGSGGATVHVTNLNDAGAGSLRDAVSGGSRIVVFDLAGTLTLRSPLVVHSDVTLAGQSAPGEGVTVMGQEVSFSNAANVIVRYLRFREGLTGGKHKSAVALHAGRRMIFDHCSIGWGRWDCIDMNGSTDITFQNCLIGPGVNPQRFGCLCGSDNVTFCRDLFIDNQSRNPKAKGHIQYINNVVYNWGVDGFVGGHSAAVHAADLLNNYFIAGPNSSRRWNGEWAATDQVYQAGNYADLDRDGRLNGHLANAQDFSGPTLVSVPFFHPPVPVTVTGASEAYSQVVRDAGCSRHRDAVDVRLIGELTSLGTRGQLIEDPKEGQN